MPTTDQLEEATIRAFGDQLRGEILQPGDEGYDEARTVWNAMIDKEPAVIARCTGAADVIAAVDFARDLDFPLSVKGGGHNVAGDAVCDDGLTIDLSRMDGVRVDPESRTARVGGGATWGALDHEAQAFGLATTGGIVSTTGVAGLTLGGGLGYLDRLFGLAHDNLRSLDVVTANGRFVRASADHHPDLFWGMRGGGGNFGIATSLEFDLHPVGPEVLAGRLVYPYEATPEVLRYYREFMADGPPEVQCYAGFIRGGPGMDLPENLHGTTLLGLGVIYIGDIDDGRDVLRPLREVGEPIADTVGPMRYTAFQQRLDDLYREGHRNYWKSRFYDDLSDEFIETVMDQVDPMPTPSTTVFLEWMEGAIAEAAPDATAFPHRDKAFSFTIAPRWTDPERDDELIAWARDFHEAVAPFAADGVYVNYLGDDENERIQTAYGDRYERLTEVKNEWDPTNLFRLNQNIEPPA